MINLKHQSRKIPRWYVTERALRIRSTALADRHTLDDNANCCDTFKLRAKIYPVVEELQELI